ncbi:hypothetical protein QTP88_022867 [Uroleucon formosanum]
MNSNSGFLHKNIEIENDDSAQDNESSNDEEESLFGDKNKVVNNLAIVQQINVTWLASEASGFVSFSVVGGWVGGKYDAILAIFKRALLFQYVVLSMVFIVIWFCFIMSFSSDKRFNSSSLITIKIFSAIPATVFKLFGTCYLFGNIHDQKDSIIFALYSSNWPEMDMKCKKLILLAMKMNNANQKKLKFTRTKIINLEMFFKTIRDSYSILSVLVNYIKNMNE